jgi:hypothetical protein
MRTSVSTLNGLIFLFLHSIILKVFDAKVIMNARVNEINTLRVSFVLSKYVKSHIHDIDGDNLTF